jgi:hypothetical protein
MIYSQSKGRNTYANHLLQNSEQNTNVDGTEGYSNIEERKTESRNQEEW